jgi:hypothetical protein
MKKLVRFLENPKIYKSAVLLLILAGVYIAVIDPVVRGRAFPWQAPKPSMYDANFMRGK